jgi:hypothetical protein
VSVIAAGKLATYGGVGLPFAIYGVAFVLLFAAVLSVPDTGVRARSGEMGGFMALRDRRWCRSTRR